MNACVCAVSFITLKHLKLQLTSIAHNTAIQIVFTSRHHIPESKTKEARNV